MPLMLLWLSFAMRRMRASLAESPRSLLQQVSAADKGVNAVSAGGGRCHSRTTQRRPRCRIAWLYGGQEARSAEHFR